MDIVSLLHRLLLVPLASAGTLDETGTSSPGVGQMWQMITNQFTLSGLTPLGAVEFFTSRIIAFSFSIIGALAVGLIMYAGIRMSIGGEEGMTEAKKVIQYTLIGVALALIAGTVIAFVRGILNGLLS